ncbi:CoA transferase [Streptomyces sp900129855]|uniref:CoA transferase n=1 Tax=Streptomyces sp. 900129855 TaxID=3155129 RepID=A0ABV2ZUY6_9ACTN
MFVPPHAFPPDPARTGTSHAAIVPYGTFAAGDGTGIVLSLQNEREWASFCRTVLARADLPADEHSTAAADV